MKKILFPRQVLVVCLLVCAGVLITQLASAPQDVNRDAYAREYVQLLVTQLDEWTKSFPQTYNMALMRPPVDAAKLSEGAKSGASDLRESITRLSSLSNSKDLLTNTGFREQLTKSLAAAKEVNQAMGTQKFPGILHSDWEQIRTNLNNLARIYKSETLAVIEPPAPAKSGAATRVAAAAVPGGITGYIVDQMCATRGKGMWTNAACVARCVREGDNVVLVTEEGKVYRITNQDKVESDTYGSKVVVTGKTDGDVITIATVSGG